MNNSNIIFLGKYVNVETAVQRHCTPGELKGEHARTGI